MREIKFRAWDGHKMQTDFAIDADDGMPSLLGYSPTEPVPQFKVMQFSGLQDKNGKDIYEGDIVYLAGYGTYQCEFPFIELYEAGAEGDIGGILGNVHQNPELLGD